MNENENIIYQNSQNTKKAVTRGKFTAVNNLIKNYKDLNSITYNSTRNWKKSKLNSK